MENLVNNNLFLLYIVTILYASISGVKFTERARISLVYIMSLVLAMVGSIPLPYIIFGATMALFVSLEILSDDELKLQLFTSLRYKLTDFFYLLFIEYYYHYFLLSVAWLAPHQVKPWNYIIAGLVMLYATIRLMAQKYATKSITAIIARFESQLPIYHLDVSNELRLKFVMLTRLEDHGFYARSDRQHSIPARLIIRKGWTYIHIHKGKGVIKSVRDLFNRGYGTIEMQLIRSIGIELGYDAHKYKRKVFEFLYANMILNGYQDYLQRRGINSSHYRDFIIWHYIENVQIKINGKQYLPGKHSSLLQLFGKNSLDKITKEEFFIWCAGLPQWGRIGPIVLGMYAPIIREFGLNERLVYKKLYPIGGYAVAKSYDY